MRLFHFLLVFLCFSSSLSGQSLKESREYIIKTPFIESDGRQVSLTMDEQAFLLVKAKGGNSQYSQYFLQCFDKELRMQWSVKKEFAEEQQVLGIFQLGNQLILVWAEHDTRQLSRKVQAETYNPKSGDLLLSEELVNLKVAFWKDAPNKGRSARGLQNVINSGNRKNLVTPLEYRFETASSPDHSKLMIYAYDYSREDLYIDIFIYEQGMALKSKARVPVNRGFIHQENIVNNDGNVYMINRRDNGLIAVVQYDMENRKSEYIEMDESNSLRKSFKGVLSDNNKLMVGNLNTRNDQLVGISYSTFNFDTEKVEKVVFKAIDEPFKQEIDLMREFEDQPKDEEDWNYYELIKFHLHTDGSKTLIIEQRDYQSRGYFYDPEAGDEKGQWGERLGELYVGDVFIFHYNSDDELQWRKTVLKQQKGNAHEGLNLIGIRGSTDKQGNIRLFYELYGKAHHALHYLKLDKDTGKEQVNEILDNPEKLNILLPYLNWLEDSFILVGKKGLSGKNSYILLYGK